jgi:hypothetical protein
VVSTAVGKGSRSLQVGPSKRPTLANIDWPYPLVQMVIAGVGATIWRLPLTVGVPSLLPHHSSGASASSKVLLYTIYFLLF